MCWELGSSNISCAPPFRERYRSYKGTLHVCHPFTDGFTFPVMLTSLGGIGMRWVLRWLVDSAEVTRGDLNLLGLLSCTAHTRIPRIFNSASASPRFAAFHSPAQEARHMFNCPETSGPFAHWPVPVGNSFPLRFSSLVTGAFLFLDGAKVRVWSRSGFPQKGSSAGASVKGKGTSPLPHQTSPFTGPRARSFLRVSPSPTKPSEPARPRQFCESPASTPTSEMTRETAAVALGRR